METVPLVSDAHALTSAPPDAATGEWLEHAGLLALFGVVAALQFSIAVAQALLAISIFCWLSLVVWRRERIDVPRFFWPLLAYAAATLVSAAFSPQPRVSLVDCKQLVLFLVVPLTYRLVAGDRAPTLVTVMVTAGAASAAIGIVQYGILHYDQLGMRARGTLGHYMTYSGLLMLVIGAALARVLFGRRDRLWPGLVMPALVVAVALTFTRSAAVGCCAAAALLLALKDFRLIAVLPIAAAILLVLSPEPVTRRFTSIFDLTNATTRDRVAMLREGQRMVRAHPFVGVGPNMVQALYPQYRDAEAVESINPHLHNVPVQIAAERGLPALVLWVTFLAVLCVDLARLFRFDHVRVLAAAGLASITGMLAAGMFEYNFGDSEFLMLFLTLITLPFAAQRPAAADAS
jgi:O-antigen ligase